MTDATRPTALDTPTTLDTPTALDNQLTAGATGRRETIRVLLVGQAPPKAGGIPTFLGDLMTCRTFQESVDVTLLDLAPATHVQLGTFATAHVRRSLGHALLVRREAAGRDVVHLNMAGAPRLPVLRALACSLAARRAGAAVVLHIHSGRVEHAVADSVYRLLLKITGRHAEAVLVVSAAGCEAVRRVVPAAKLVPNGIDTTRFRPPVPRQPSGGRPRLLFAGTVCAEKGLLDLKEALRLLASQAPDGRPPVDVTIVGDSRQAGPRVDTEIRRAFRDGGLADVAFVGSRDRTQLAELLSTTDVYCLPSWSEGAPMGILEAMACGLAVVATSVGEIPLMLDGGRAGLLVPPKDPPLLAAAIASLAGDHVLRRQLGARARDRVEARYRLEDTASRLVEVYRRSAGGRGRPVPTGM